MSIVINDIDSQYFTFNGIRYFKNFTPVVRGNNIEIVNTYDRKISLTDAPTIYTDYTVDGNTFASVELLQNALLPVIYTRNSLNSSSESGLITTGYTKATDFGNANFYPKSMFLDVPIQDDANTDIWLASTFTNQRVIHHFGEGVELDKITYVNGTRSVDGSSVTFGAKTVTIYAITANVDPVFTYNVTDANYTQIFTGNFAQYTIAQAKNPPELTLSNIPATTFALVYDIADNHASSGRIEIRRLSAFKK